MAVIRGKWDTGTVWIDDRELSPERSQAVVDHSPTGFSWGYYGSGPAQLALALLLEITSKEMAVLWYQEVKREIIARLSEIVDFIVSEVARRLDVEEG